MCSKWVSSWLWRRGVRDGVNQLEQLVATAKHGARDGRMGTDRIEGSLVS